MVSAALCCADDGAVLLISGAGVPPPVLDMDMPLTPGIPQAALVALVWE
jgi:hypothetical protein